MDRRIWQPDETCEGWLWETSVSSTGGSLGQFRVPPDTLAVLTGILTTSGNTNIAKETARLNIVPDTPTGQPVRLYGAISEVTELASTGVNTPGLAICANGSTRPIRIILKGGLYFVVQTGNPGSIVGVSLFGHAFRTRV